jgi:hypothetical protein
MITVKHSGNVGDIIYSLPVVMHLSKIENNKIKFYLNPIDNRMSLELAGVLKPLLEHQPYIDSVDIYDNQYIDYDLDLFRTIHPPLSNLGELHAKVFDYDFSILKEQSIFINDSCETNLPVYDIIINRTERYNNPLFPWQTILNTHYANHSKCFIGTRSEYESFLETYSFSDIDYVPTTDFLQVAWLIKNSKIFIGNCSSPYAIAETLKHTSIQESCTWCLSCLYQRSNAYYFTDQLIQI